MIGDMHKWLEEIPRIREMGFNWIYVNPFHYPGFSGSLYAVKDYFRMNPLFIPQDHPQDPLKLLTQVVKKINQNGFQVMMGLVVNHTAKDSIYALEHPTWFERDEKGEIVSPSAIDPADARKVTVWGDLAKFDHHDHPGREELWQELVKIVEYYTRAGFTGFRCDAAYQVPCQLWQLLIKKASKINNQVQFFAETMGARLEQQQDTLTADFSYIFNSSKWWQFDQDWCLVQQKTNSAFCPSISFPESHDTDRLFQETYDNLAVQKQRYAFAAWFSRGLMMPIGYEYGFRKKLNVVHTTPLDFQENKNIDIQDFIKRVNQIKIAQPILSIEGEVQNITAMDSSTIVLKKFDQNFDKNCGILINKDWQNQQRVILPQEIKGKKAYTVCQEEMKEFFLDQDELLLEPAEVIYCI